MEIPQDNYSEIFAFLNQELISGKKWVVYEAGSMIKRKMDLHVFSKEYDARQYAHDNTSDFDTMITGSIKNILLTIKQNTMNSQNLEFLQTNLKYFGFGDKLNADLEKNIKEQKQEFQLKTEIPHFNNKMEYTLHFKKSDSSEMYFFNRYDASLKNDKPENDKTQSFYINKGSGVTAKEAFNLLEGRSVFKDLVNKEGQKYSAWLKLDFGNADDKGNFKLKQFSEQYGYNLEKTLSSFPIKELNDQEQKKHLLSSLEKGNVQQVTISREGKESKYYIEAIPQFKNINVYDQKMHMVKRQNVQEFNGQSVARSEKPAKRNENKVDDSVPKQRQTRKRKMSV